MFEFRVAAKADAPAVEDITDRAYAVWVPVLGYPPQPMLDDHAVRIGRGEVLLVCQRGEVFGLISVEPGPDQHLIFSVAVDPEHGRKGIGPRLIAEAERRATEAGAGAMALYTSSLMERNIALYRHLGYNETGRRPHPVREGFTIVDMRKPLRSL